MMMRLWSSCGFVRKVAGRCDALVLGTAVALKWRNFYI
jgi:hypothetical protein